MVLENLADYYIKKDLNLTKNYLIRIIADNQNFNRRMGIDEYTIFEFDRIFELYNIAYYLKETNVVNWMINYIYFNLDILLNYDEADFKIYDAESILWIFRHRLYILEYLEKYSEIDVILDMIFRIFDRIEEVNKKNKIILLPTELLNAYILKIKNSCIQNNIKEANKYLEIFDQALTQLEEGKIELEENDKVDFPLSIFREEYEQLRIKLEEI